MSPDRSILKHFLYPICIVFTIFGNTQSGCFYAYSSDVLVMLKFQLVQSLPSSGTHAYMNGTVQIQSGQWRELLSAEKKQPLTKTKKEILERPMCLSRE